MHPGKNKILITGSMVFLDMKFINFYQKNNVIGTSKKKINPFIKLDYPKDQIDEKYLENVNTVIHLASLDRDQVKENIALAKKINVKFTENLIKKC